MSRLAERLKKLLAMWDMSQEELSARSGVSQSQISRYVRDQADISGEHLIMIARVFSVPTDYLLGITESDPSKLAPKERQALSKWRSGDRIGAIRVIAEDETG